ncbi:transposase [Klebsiella pneumoniae]
MTSRSLLCIYDEPDKQSAQNAFEAWKNSLPPYGMEPFKKLVKTVHNHYDDIFAYWDAPFSLTNGYTEGLNGLIKMSNRLGRGYSYEIIRAKTLYSKEARKVGSGIPSRTRQGRVWTAHSDIVEAGERWRVGLTRERGASENPTNVRFSQGGEKQKNPTRSSFCPTKNQGLEWMNSNPRMQIAI